MQAADRVEYLLRLGDTALILGQRLSEWCGRGPALEEDIALTNTALDLIGHARLWLTLAGKIEGKGRTEDDLAYLREAGSFRNLLLVEQPNGDYGATLMRQFLFDAWHLPTLQGLAASSDADVAAIAEKAAKEVAYHRDRSADLVVRLGDGTEESHARMQTALDRLWPFALEPFAPDDLADRAAEAGYGPARSVIEEAWREDVAGTLTTATLALPEGTFAQTGGLTGRHTERLGFVLAEMQSVARAHPGASW